MKRLTSRRRSQSGQVLIAFIIAIVIILIVMGSMYESGKHGGVYDQSMDRANDIACTSNAQQIRQAIMMYRQDNEHRNPPDMKSLSKYGVTGDLYNSPGCVITYDATSGQITVPNNKPGAPAADATPPGSGSPAAAPSSAPSTAPSSSPPSTTVQGPTGAPIRIPTGGGNVDVNGGN